MFDIWRVQQALNSENMEKYVLRICLAFDMIRYHVYRVWYASGVLCVVGCILRTFISCCYKILSEYITAGNWQASVLQFGLA